MMPTPIHCKYTWAIRYKYNKTWGLLAHHTYGAETFPTRKAAHAFIREIDPRNTEGYRPVRLVPATATHTT